VLLATVRPGQILAGKVLGIGLVAFAQAALVVRSRSVRPRP
jgi:ABC-type Na+ efflux pump permease subunit